MARSLGPDSTRRTGEYSVCPTLARDASTPRSQPRVSAVRDPTRQGQQSLEGVLVLVADSTALCLAVFLVIPAIGGAQTLVVTAPPDPAPPIPLSQATAPELIDGANGLVRNPNWWQPPVSHSSFPRWAIGHTVAFTTVGGLTLSAGLFGRQGDPLPLYLSERSGPRVGLPPRLNFRSHRLTSSCRSTRPRVTRRSSVSEAAE
jgi:hypothetical protein